MHAAVAPLSQHPRSLGTVATTSSPSERQQGTRGRGQGQAGRRPPRSAPTRFVLCSVGCASCFVLRGGLVIPRAACRSAPQVRRRRPLSRALRPKRREAAAVLFMPSAFLAVRARLLAGWGWWSTLRWLGLFAARSGLQVRGQAAGLAHSERWSGDRGAAPVRAQRPPRRAVWLRPPSWLARSLEIAVGCMPGEVAGRGGWWCSSGTCRSAPALRSAPAAVVAVAGAAVPPAVAWWQMRLARSRSQSGAVHVGRGGGAWWLVVRLRSCRSVPLAAFRAGRRQLPSRPLGSQFFLPLRRGTSWLARSIERAGWWPWLARSASGAGMGALERHGMSTQGSAAGEVASQTALSLDASAHTVVVARHCGGNVRSNLALPWQ